MTFNNQNSGVTSQNSVGNYVRVGGSAFFSPKDERRQVNPALCVTRVRLISSFLTIARLIDKAVTELCQNCDWLRRSLPSVAQVLSE
ncbi:MAG: hypothetical protein ACYTXA_31995 [Nostoc sp.]